MAEKLEPLWLTVLLLRVPEAFGCYISLHSARAAFRLTVFGLDQRVPEGRPARTPRSP